jgi:alpha-beta hydrolase superfamily lysophospholipase
LNANRLIEEWRQQGRILEVEGANTVLWRMGQGETVICVHGVPTSGFLYRKLLPELASRGLEGVTLDLPGLGLAAPAAKKTFATLSARSGHWLKQRCPKSAKLENGVWRQRLASDVQRRKADK